VTGGEGSAAEKRLWSAAPDGTREWLVDQLSATDLQTVLLSVARERAAAVTPASLVRRWREDRFVRPARTDPRQLAEVESWLWRLLPDDVEGVELSPLVPWGTCSALGPVSQNRVVTTMRLTEVVSDSTNALAVEAAHRRRRQGPSGEVTLAAGQRQVRAQTLGPGQAAHFRLFALVSSARDLGSGRTEARLLVRHLTHWQQVLAAMIPAASPQVRYTVLDSAVVRERVVDTVLPATGGLRATVPLVEDPARRRGRGYYTSAALQLTADHEGAVVDLGDGGFTSWTAQLLGDAKERCLVSCVATERLAAIRRASLSTAVT
jgi:hypothetical protein